MKKSWQDGLKKHVGVLIKGGNPRHLRRVSSFLLRMSSDILEVGEATHTTLLRKYPHMPIKYFALCLGVPLATGRTIYKDWHEFWELEIPRHGNLDRGERKQWEEIVAQELSRKNK